MKRIMNIYDNCRIAVRLTFLGFILIAFSSIITSESVNIFYTFRNPILLLFAEGCGKLGQAIVMNIPMIFMLNMVCKKANSGYPVVLVITGYFAFLITTSLFGNTNLVSTAYTTASGLNSTFNISNGSRYPFELGLITSFIVSYITKISFVRSRHRSTLSILGFLNKDTAGFIYNIVFCTIAGMGVAFVWPYVITNLQTLITYIGKDLQDPVRIGIYGILDRLLSVIGIGNIVKYPFWYTTLGGSYQTISGQSIVGDINIWNYVKDISSTYIGAGRFVSAYYVINMFLIPSILLCILTITTNKIEKRKLLFPILGLTLFSFAYGNALPFEFIMLFTSPLLFVFYLIAVGAVYWYFTLGGIYLGSNIAAGTSTITAMPGNFPDFVINLRNIFYINTLGRIVLVGLVVGILLFIVTYLYFRFMAYDLMKTGKTSEFSKSIIDAVGGKENVLDASNTLFRLCIDLKDLEQLDVLKVQDLHIKRVMETKRGIEIECGTSAYMLAKRINWLLEHEEN